MCTKLPIERASLPGPEGAVEWGSGTYTTIQTDQWRARDKWDQVCLHGPHAGDKETQILVIMLTFQY